MAGDRARGEVEVQGRAHSFQTIKRGKAWVTRVVRNEPKGHRMKKAAIAALCAALGLVVASSAGAGGTAKTGILSFKATLTVGQELAQPAKVMSGTKGRLVATLNGSTLKFTVWYDQLSTVPAKAVLFGANGTKFAVLCKNCSSTTAYDTSKTTGSGKGQVILTKPQINALTAGKTYVNIMTPVNPKGEIRGNIVWVH
jgi:hypothetical protein